MQEVIMRAMAIWITWWQAAEIPGVTDRTMRRWTGTVEAKWVRGLYERHRHP